MVRGRSFPAKVENCAMKNAVEFHFNKHGGRRCLASARLRKSSVHCFVELVGAWLPCKTFRGLPCCIGTMGRPSMAAVRRSGSQERLRMSASVPCELVGAWAPCMSNFSRQAVLYGHQCLFVIFA